MSLKESETFKVLKQKAIELCELPKAGLSSTLNSKKKAMELRYIQSPSRLTFSACSLLNHPSRMVKQSMLECDDLAKRITKVTNLLNAEIDVSYPNWLLSFE
jgi:hypothetical protein